MARDERVCRIHSLEMGTREIRPGGTIRIGRHHDNELVLNDTMVSRFHARVTWDKELERPVVFDNGSQNGTQVDGKPVKTAEPLRNQAKVTIGPFLLRIELVGCGDTPAVLKDTNDMVTLFSDDGPDLVGSFRAEMGVRELMQRLESERRTGTLHLEFPSARGFATYCLGRIMAVSLDGQGTGLRALEKMVMRRPEGRYRFSRELEPQEEALNLWVSDFLRTRQMDPGDATQRFRRPP